MLSIPNEPRIPGQVKNRAALLKLINSPGFDNHAYYHFQNGELIEKSGDPMLSEETKRSLTGRDGGPIYTWGVRPSTYLSGLSSSLPSLADVGSGFCNNCAVVLSLTPPCELFGHFSPRCVFYRLDADVGFEVPGMNDVSNFPATHVTLGFPPHGSFARSPVR